MHELDWSCEPLQSGTGVAEPAERRVADAALASGVDLQFQKPVWGSGRGWMRARLNPRALLALGERSNAHGF